MIFGTVRWCTIDQIRIEWVHRRLLGNRNNVAKHYNTIFGSSRSWYREFLGHTQICLLCLQHCQGLCQTLVPFESFMRPNLPQNFSLFRLIALKISPSKYSYYLVPLLDCCELDWDLSSEDYGSFQTDPVNLMFPTSQNLDPMPSHEYSKPKQKNLLSSSWQQIIFAKMASYYNWLRDPSHCRPCLLKDMPNERMWDNRAHLIEALCWVSRH